MEEEGGGGLRRGEYKNAVTFPETALPIFDRGGQAYFVLVAVQQAGQEAADVLMSKLLFVQVAFEDQMQIAMFWDLRMRCISRD